MSTARAYCELGILESGDTLAQKPASYDWQFFKGNYSMVDPEALDILKIEN